jgi:hypothetical protein
MTASIFTSVCALFLTLYGLWATRRHNRLSVTPHLCSHTNKLITEAGLVLTYEISNNGIGPARIKKVVLFRNDQEFPKPENDVTEHVHSLIRAHLDNQIKFTINHSFSFGNDFSLKAGDAKRIAEIFFPEVKEDTSPTALKKLEGLDMLIEYESYYGQKLTFDTRVERANKTK